MSTKEKIKEMPDFNLIVPILFGLVCTLTIASILFFSKICICSKISSIGLTFDFLGVFLILIYGIPTKYIDTKYKRNSVKMMFEEESDINKENYERQVEDYNNVIKINFLLGSVYLLLGFGFQILSNFIQI